MFSNNIPPIDSLLTPEKLWKTIPGLIPRY
jgi:hypothetical protein